MPVPTDICLHSCFKFNPHLMMTWTPTWLIVSAYKVSFLTMLSNTLLLCSYFLETEQDIDVFIKYFNTLPNNKNLKGN